MDSRTTGVYLRHLKSEHGEYNILFVLSATEDNTIQAEP